MSQIIKAIKSTAEKQTPLSMKEEARLGTLSHCLTMALFKVYDSQKNTPILSGWPRQCVNKLIDDEIFGANVDSVSKFAEGPLQIKDPISNVYTKAAVGVASRFLTLTVLVPFQNTTDPDRRRALSKSNARVPMYHGFARQALKECVFTATYVISSTLFGDYLSARKQLIRQSFAKCCTRDIQNATCKSVTDETLPKTDASTLGSIFTTVSNPFGSSNSVNDKTKADGVMKCGCLGTICKCPNKCLDTATELAIVSSKAAAAGILSTVAIAPIEYYGKPKSGAVKTTICRAGRKGCYNAVNAAICKTLQKKAIHRALARTLFTYVIPETQRTFC